MSLRSRFHAWRDRTPVVRWADRTGIDSANPSDEDIDEIAEYGFGWVTVGLPIGASEWSTQLNRIVDRAHGHGMRVAFVARSSSWSSPMIQPFGEGCRAALDVGIDRLILGGWGVGMPTAFSDAGRAPCERYPGVPVLALPSESWAVADVYSPEGIAGIGSILTMSLFDLWTRRIERGVHYDGHMIRTWRDTTESPSGLVTIDGTPKQPLYDRVRYRLKMVYPQPIPGV